MDKKLKILIINYEFPPLGGGGGIASYDFALEWVKNAQVDVITSSFKGLKSYEKMEEINVHRVKIFFRKSRDAASFLSLLTYLPGAFFKGIKLVRKNRYDVINTHFAVPSGPVGYLLGKIFNIPNVLSLHGGDVYDPSKKMSPHNSWIFSRAVKFIMNRADRIVAQSGNTKENAIKYYNPNKEIDIISLAFHPPEKVTGDKEHNKKELGFAKDDFLLMSIGRIVKRKALDVIIKALAIIDNEKIKFIVAGDGPELDFLKSEAKRLNVDSKINFIGFVDDDTKNRYLSIADLFTLTSLHEGFGIVYMEAMYMGLPIVCTNHGGQTDFLINNENAILINVGDIDGCVEAINRFITDKTLYNRCSRNNIEKIKDFFAEKVSIKYIDIYNELIKK